MRVDRVVRDELLSLKRVLEALDHNLTARDNLAPEGEVGWVLTSRGLDQIPQYAPVSLSGSTIPWSQVTDRPTTLAGYGIENAALSHHTHPASDIVSGILDTPRLGSGVAGVGSYLRGDSTWQPLSLAGLGIASEVASYLSAPRWDEGTDDWPLMIPGPKGDTGPTGASGSGGSGSTMQLINEELYDSWADMHLPGERGPQGSAGPAGPTGPGVTVVQLSEEYTEPWAEMLVPGGTGPQGAAGATNYLMFDFEDPPDPDLAALPAFGLASAAAAAAGSGVTGAGTSPFMTRWTGAATIGSSIFKEQNGGLFVQTGGDPTGHHFGRVATDNLQIRTNDDGTGAQIDATKPSWAFAFGEGASDNFVFYRKPAGGAYAALWKLSNAGVLFPATDNALDVGGPAQRVRTTYSVAVASGTTANAAMINDAGGGVLAVGAGSSFTQLNFYRAGTARWHIPSGDALAPVANNTYDVGTTALRLRDIWITGENIGENGSNTSTAAQAAIANALTDLTGCTWAVGTNEVWLFEAWVVYTRNATAANVNFAVNGPAGMTLQFTAYGTTTTVAAISATVQQNLVNTATTGTTAFGSGVGIANHWAVIRGRLTTAGTAGTAAIRASTTAAAGTMTPGHAYVIARRIS